MTFFVMNLACFLLKIGSAPNFRPAFKFFSWQTAVTGSLTSAAAMFFIDDTYAAAAICLLIFLFSLIHYLSPPKRWGDVSQNLIYHQVRKYLLRLKPEHIKFWRPQIILLVNNPRHNTRLIQLCNSMKKGALYILGHVIVTNDFNTGVDEARLQQSAWASFISNIPRLKAFVQLTMSPSITWGIRNLILSAGLGGMRPNIAVLGFYNMDELRRSRPLVPVPCLPTSPTTRSKMSAKAQGKAPGRLAAGRRRGDTSARILEGFLPTDVIRTEEMMSPTDYMTILEDLTLRYKLNVAVGKGCETLETPRHDGSNTKKYIDLWPIQMSAEIMTEGKSILTSNFDTCGFPIGFTHSVYDLIGTVALRVLDTLILQLGYILSSVPAWKKAYKLRVLVFVEYESEVEEETARVKALLDKLRIDAETHVFWLACGELHTYECIINGHCDDIDTEIMVNDTLRDEDWWDELQRFRGRPDSMNHSQEMNSLAAILDATSRRPGVYNPHADMDELSKRRASIIDLPNRSSMVNLTRLGVNVGIHTHHLGDEVFDEQIDQLEHPESDGENSDGNSANNGFSDSDASATCEGDGADSDSSTEPLLSTVNRRRSFADILAMRSSTQRHKPKKPSRPTVKSGEPSSLSYGTMESQPPVRGKLMQSSITVPTTGNNKRDQPGKPSKTPAAAVTPSGSGRMTPETTKTARIHPQARQEEQGAGTPRPLIDKGRGASTAKKVQYAPHNREPSVGQSLATEAPPVAPIRPAMSRQSSAVRFTSRPMPETTTNVSDHHGPTIMFADSASEPKVPQAERPSFSRHSSTGRFNNRLVPEHKLLGEEAIPRPSLPGSLHHSRKGSAVSDFRYDHRVDIPDLLGSYRFDSPKESVGEGSSYSTQSLALSFNDLPSRAQHLILNELMRGNSEDTALMFTTLPVPSDGTSLDEEATLAYLSDVEVLCNGLPPVLLVLSNNMTVTVGL